MPIFDSMQLLLSVKDFVGDTTYVQSYEVYELNKPLVEAMANGKDTIAYINFDMEQIYDSSKPLFTSNSRIRRRESIQPRRPLQWSLCRWLPIARLGILCAA